MQRLRELREKKGMTQTQVGDLIDVSCVTIGRYESGEREPSNDKIIALANFFGVSVDYLLGNDQPEEAAGEKTEDQELEELVDMLKKMPKEDLEKVAVYARFIHQK